MHLKHILKHILIKKEEKQHFVQATLKKKKHVMCDFFKVYTFYYQ